VAKCTAIEAITKVSIRNGRFYKLSNRGLNAPPTFSLYLATSN